MRTRHRLWPRIIMILTWGLRRRVCRDILLPPAERLEPRVLSAEYGIIPSTVLPESFFTQLRQVFEADPSDWDARAWSHAGDSLSCEWRVVDTDDGVLDTHGGVWQMECGAVPKVYASESLRNHSSPTMSERPGDSDSTEDWKRCFLQLSVSDFVEILAGDMNANTAVFENRLRLAGDLESLPLLNIALVKMKALVKKQAG